MSQPPPPQPAFTFRKSLRLRTREDFDAAYKRGAAKVVGPLRVLGLPNSLTHCRLGLNVSRRVGNSVVRNRVKRMIREAFRLSQHDLPGGYDLLVIARPHEPLPLADYRRMLLEAAGKVERHWAKPGRT